TPRPHQRRDEAFPLVDEAQGFAPDDALHADQILRERVAAIRGYIRGDVGGGYVGHATIPAASATAPCVNLVNAEAMFGVAEAATTFLTVSLASTRPRCRTTTLSSSPTSSIR